MRSTNADTKVSDKGFNTKAGIVSENCLRKFSTKNTDNITSKNQVLNHRVLFHSPHMD